MHGRLAYVKLRDGGNPCTKNSPETSFLRDDSKERLRFKAAFHVSCGLILEKKSIQRKQ